jgi:hypothetical protein
MFCKEKSSDMAGRLLLLCIMVLTTSGKIYSQQQDGIVWKATLTYFMQTDDLKKDSTGNVFENDIINYLRTENEIGGLRKTLKIMFDELAEKKHPFFFVNPSNHFMPIKQMSGKEIDTATSYEEDVMDSLERYHHLRLADEYSDLIGLNLNQEWFYNLNTHAITVQITDAGFIVQKRDPGGNALNAINYIGAFKYGNRSNDTCSKMQTVDNPEIGWAKSFTLPLYYDKLYGARICHITLPDSLYKFYENRYYDKPIWNDTVSASAIPLKTLFGTRLTEWIYSAAIKGSILAFRNVMKANDDGEVYYDAGDKLTEKGLDTAITEVIPFNDSTGMVSPVRIRIEVSELTGLQVVQEVSFNSKTFSFDSKILRMAILAKKRTYDNPYPSAAVLFWVKFE